MRAALFTLMLLGSSLALAATVYKWVDENGVVHYSDQPHPNAQKVQVKAVQTFKALPAEPNASAPAAVPSENAPTYQGCAVTQPADGAEMANVDSLNVFVRTDPALRPGDQVFISMDGQLLNNGRSTGSQFTISPVDRGTHTLQATVKDADGALMCQTPGITFNVHQPSVLNPNNPVRPR